ncbi:MAG TPA: site-2 protease family protein [Candidatus Paceibacterota bacterium]|nr:site-2 protease family protein [Candidatus Paceibacterota bacterium]
MTDSTTLIFSIVILLFSVIIHEISHGYAAERLGDPTARYAGRLTLNPIPHLDLIGSILLPLLLIFSGSPFMIGWAKPVPYNPFNLRNQRWGEAIVAIAGPLVNIFIFLLFGLIIRFYADVLSLRALTLMSTVVLINIVLAIFNLVPIPPLDGSKILFSILPYRARAIRFNLERYGFVLVLVFVIFFWQYLTPLIASIFATVTGIPV